MRYRWADGRDEVKETIEGDTARSRLRSVRCRQRCRGGRLFGVAASLVLLVVVILVLAVVVFLFFLVTTSLVRVRFGLSVRRSRRLDALRHAPQLSVFCESAQWNGCDRSCVTHCSES